MTSNRLTRRDFHKIAGSLFPAAGLLGASKADAASAPRFAFPCGTHIYREPPLPMEQLHADLPLLKKLGFTMVKIQESWSVDERKEGQIDLSKISQLISDARQNGLLIYFGVTMEQAPAWLWRKFPDARMQWENGEPLTDPTQYLLPNDGKPGPCWDHPGARAAATRFIEAVGKEIGRYDNILVWNVWQEVALESSIGSHIGLCYCPNTIAAFQNWLRSKFTSLAALNANWRTAYADWNEIDPPRRFTKVPSSVDWRYFMENAYLAGGLGFKAEAFRRSDPLHRRILAHTGGPRYGSSADWRLARAVDVYGSSAYPGWSEFEEPAVSNDQRLRESPAVSAQLNGLVMQWDYLRGASVQGEFWDAELQGGRAGGGITPGRVPDARDIRRWMLVALAGGARGICFWNHRTEPFWDEAYGFGLMELRGGETERAKEAGRISRALTEHAAELLGKGSVPPAETAILIDEDLWNFIGGSGPEIKAAFVDNLRGTHLAAWQHGIPIDFLDTRDLGSWASQYKALIFPLPLALSGEVIGRLRTYVQGGGTLISGACPGRFDQYGFGMLGEMPDAIAESFGVEHVQLLSLFGRKAHPTQNTFEPKDPAPVVLQGAGSYSSIQVEASFYLQYLKPGTATPVLTFSGQTVGTVNRFGSGKAILIGTLFGTPVFEHAAPGNAMLLTTLLREAGVQPDRVGKLVRRRRTYGKQSAWFLFNQTRTAVEQELETDGSKTALDLLSGPLQLRDGKVTVTIGPLDIGCLILEG